MQHLTLLIFSFILSTVVYGTTYTIDPSQSYVGFAPKHLNDGIVKGHFTRFEGEIEWNEATQSPTSISATIDATSLNTKNRMRDSHLKSRLFFFSKKHPNITYTLTNVEKAKGKTTFVGNLSIKGITQETRFTPTAEHADGKLTLKLMTILNRHDYKVSAYKPLIPAEVPIDLMIVATPKN